MSVELSLETAVAPAAEVAERTRRAALFLLEELGRSSDELSIALVGDDEIQRLNRVYRGRDCVTDVLSFALDQDESVTRRVPGEISDVAAAEAVPAGSEEVLVLLGDIVISLDAAGRQARQGGWSLEEELNRLLLHGLLHLLGFDHETGGVEQALMQAEEQRLADRLAASGFACAAENLG